jgi:hypothetical protein
MTILADFIKEEPGIQSKLPKNIFKVFAAVPIREVFNNPTKFSRTHQRRFDDDDRISVVGILKVVCSFFESTLLGTIDGLTALRYFLAVDRSLDNLTPEERWRAQQAMGINVGGFLSIVVDRLLKEPPPRTEPYTPPKEEVPPGTYIPLAHR